MVPSTCHMSSLLPRAHVWRGREIRRVSANIAVNKLDSDMSKDAGMPWKLVVLLGIVLVVLSLVAPAKPMVGSAATAVAVESCLGDVAVVGCGVLGTSVCRQLMQRKRPNLFTSITGITKTTTRHDDIRQNVLVGDAEGQEDKFSLSTVDEIRQNHKKFNNVVFCAPPSGSLDYAKDIEDSITTMWIKSSANKFVFTSSGAVYSNATPVVNELSSVDNDNPRANRLLQAEHACLKHSGTVLRLAGLYTLERGAHNFWLQKCDEVQGRPDGIINLLHYDDAASACIAALTAPDDDVHGKVFLISDGNPMTREEICSSALQHAMYSSTCRMPKFIFNENDPPGKIYDGSWSQKVLNWKPTYKSFRHFMSIPSESQQFFPENSSAR
jgi:nucleoside-diphosphate-sugar epimerase